MTRLLFLVLMLLPATAQGLDWSVDTGYLRYSFTGKEQLGATSPAKGLRLSTGQGPALFASTGWHSQWLTVGVRTQAAYLFLSGQPEQEHKVKGKAVDTTSLASPLLSADLTAGFHAGRYKVELGGGFATMGVGERWAAPFDFDTGAHGAISVTFEHKGMDVTLSGDFLWLPSVKAKSDLAPTFGWNITLGKASEVPVFAEPQNPQPQAELPVAVTPATDPTPTVLQPLPMPEAPTPTEAPKPAVPPPPPVAKKTGKTPPPLPVIRDDDPIILFIVSTLSSNAALEVEIRAYAPDKALGQARAEQAREVLVKHHGVEASRVWAVGKVRKGKAKSTMRDLEFAFAPKGSHK